MPITINTFLTFYTQEYIISISQPYFYFKLLEVFFLGFDIDVILIKKKK